jgi:CheY-like chemotaxis protein
VKTILIVDDDVDVRQSLAALLNVVFEAQVAAGTVRFEPAGSGLEAVERSLDCEPALLILDVNMPDLDGVETFFRITERLGHPVPTVFLTGFAASGNVKARMDRALEAGALGCMSKPVTVRELAEAVRRAVPACDGHGS